MKKLLFLSAAIIFLIISSCGKNKQNIPYKVTFSGENLDWCLVQSKEDIYEWYPQNKTEHTFEWKGVKKNVLKLRATGYGSTVSVKVYRKGELVFEDSQMHGYENNSLTVD